MGEDHIMGIESAIGPIIGLISGISSAGVQRKVGETEREAFFEEARAVQLQGALAREEAETEAGRVAEADVKAQAKQSVAFLKSGVSLVGSPLLVQAEARAESAEFTGSIRKRGEAQSNVAFARAQALRGRGRAALLTRTAQGTATGIEAISSFVQTGFGGSLFG